MRLRRVGNAQQFQASCLWLLHASILAFGPSPKPQFQGSGSGISRGFRARLKLTAILNWQKRAV